MNSSPSLSLNTFKRLLAVLLFLFALPLAQAQSYFTSPAQSESTDVQYGGFEIPTPDQQPEDAISRYAEMVSAERLREHLSIIASDEMEGRGTGTEGERKAAAYLSEQFQAMGLIGPGDNGSYLQPFELSQDLWGEVYVQAGKERFEFLKDFYGWPNSNNPLSLETDEFVFVGYGISEESYDDYAGIDVKGKVLLMLTGEPQKDEENYWLSGDETRSSWSVDWRKKTQHATDLGARAVLIVSPRVSEQLNQESFVQYIKEPRMQLLGAERVITMCNSLYLSTEMAEELFGKKRKVFEKNRQQINEQFKPASQTIRADLRINLEKERKLHTSNNVMALLPGSDKSDEYIVVSAHYDHLGKKGEEIYNGADDDGSGTVTVINIAEAMSQAAKEWYGPRRSILFLAFSGEENGLLGSEYYTDHPVFPLEQTVTNLNIDMVGRIEAIHEKNPFYIYTIGSDFLSTELHAMGEEAAAAQQNMRIDYRYNNTTDPNRYYYRSDHYNFAKNQIPVIFYFNGNHPDYHKPSDTIEKINFEVMQERGRLIFHTLWRVANAENRPAVDVDQGEN